jgi:hypothetical protein
MGLALAILETLEHLAALPGGGQRDTALLQLGAATIELQRGLLLRALDALEPCLCGDQSGARSRRGLRNGLLASGGGAGLGVGEQRNASRTQRKAGGEGLTGHVPFVGAHFPHPLQREDKGRIAHGHLVGPGPPRLRLLGPTIRPGPFRPPARCAPTNPSPAAIAE